MLSVLAFQLRPTCVEPAAAARPAGTLGAVVSAASAGAAWAARDAAATAKISPRRLARPPETLRQRSARPVAADIGTPWETRTEIRRGGAWPSVGSFNSLAAHQRIPLRPPWADRVGPRVDPTSLHQRPAQVGPAKLLPLSAGQDLPLT